MEKRSFILIEVLIAFFLIAICAVPLVKYPLQFYRTEMKQLERMELERLAYLEFFRGKRKAFEGGYCLGRNSKKRVALESF